MGLMEKTMQVRKRFSGRNLHIMKALITYVEEGYVEEEDDIEVIMNLGAYENLLRLGLYKEIKRNSRDRREGDRKK